MEDARIPIRLFTTCPPYTGSPGGDYFARVRDIARWSDEAGCDGILVYTDNSTVDPWLLSQMIVQNTKSLMPLVAVQPVYMHPYAVAKAVSSIAYLHGRRVCMNMVAGGFKNDLLALDDPTPHERRYDRLVEYTTIIQRLLGGGPVTFTGEFYRVRQLTLKPAFPRELMPLITISGSSAEGLAAARRLDAIPVKYPEPAERCAYEGPDSDLPFGIRVGIIAREQEDAAWECAHQRFPADRAGKVTHDLAMKVSDSVWHKQLSNLAHQTDAQRSTYWLVPFEHYKTFCPYLVGDYARVADEIRRYMLAGSRLFILDVPAGEEELAHIRTVFSHAAREVTFNAASANR
jgi:alkanesulfonate monooxygenase